MKLTFEEACMAVADLFESVPGLWTRRFLARNAFGYPRQHYEDDACQFCAIGGVFSAVGVISDAYAVVRLNAIANRLGFRYAKDANDQGGRKVAIRMLRIASGELKP